MSKSAVFGIWHRPNVTGGETNLKGIQNTLSAFAKAGIGVVFLETVYHGMAVYRSDYLPYRDELATCEYEGYPDYLTAFLGEAEKRKIKVHAWVEDFYIGVQENLFTKQKQEWLLVNAKGETRQSEGGGYLFLDPANGEVQNFLLALYDELLTKYPAIQGLNLDYIRYPVSTAEDDTGYTPSAMQAMGFAGKREEFKTYIKKNDLWEKWERVRADFVTGFVQSVREMLDKKHQDVLLSTAIFPEVELSYHTKKQDFTRWLERGYLDMVTPMAYYDDAATLKKELDRMMALCNHTKCWVGLSAIYHSLPLEKVYEQLAICWQEGAEGIIFFGSQFLLQNEIYRGLHCEKVVEKL